MATNFPSSQDSFTNPTSSDTLDSPDHAAQHANVNDAVEAIELALLDGAPFYIDDTNERVGIGTTYGPARSTHCVGNRRTKKHGKVCSTTGTPWIAIGTFIGGGHHVLQFPLICCIRK